MKRTLLYFWLICSFVISFEAQGQHADLIFSEYSEGSSNNKYLELYNGTGQVLDLSQYALWKITNDGNWFEREFILEGALGSGETYLIVNSSADSILLSLRDTVGPLDVDFPLFNGNEAFAIVKITGPLDTDRVIIDVIGMESGDTSPANWDVAGVEGAGGEHTWVRKPSICSPNDDWATSAGTTAEDSEWIVFDQDYWDDAGSHTTTCEAPPTDVTLELFFSEYGEGSGDNKYFELFNGTGQDIDLSNYTIWKITNEGDWFEREFEMEGTLTNGSTYMVVNKDADETLAMARDTTGPVDPEFALFNGNEAFAIVKKTGPNPEDRQILDVIGVETGTDVPAPWDVAGVVEAGAEHTWIRKASVCGPNADWASSAGTTAENSEWIVLDADNWDNIGMHTFTMPAEPTLTGLPDDKTVACNEIPTTSDSVLLTYVAANGMTISQMMAPTGLGSADICGGKLFFIYTFTDACNRTVSHIQKVVVSPIPAPDFLIKPADIEVEFADIPAPDSLTISNDGPESCEILEKVGPEILDNSSKCGGTVTYTWTYTDPCGRIITHSQRITVKGEGGKATDLFFSEYGEGSGNNKYLEIYNGTPNSVDLSGYGIWKIVNEGEWYEDKFLLEGTLGSCATYLIVNQSADETLTALRDTTGPTTPNFALFNGNEAFALVKIASESADTVIIDVIGEPSGEVSPANWNVAGVEGAGAEHTWIRKPTTCGPNADWASSAGTNAENSEWIVFDADYWDDAKLHTDECTGAVDNGAKASDLFFSEYGEGSNDNKYLEIFNGTGEAIDLTNYTIWKIINDGDWFEREFEMEGTLENNKTYLIVNKDADEFLTTLRDTTGPVEPEFTLFNGNEAFAIVRKTGPNPEDREIIDVIGKESGTESPASWDVAGIVEAGAEHTWVRKPSVCGPNTSWPASAGTNAENSEWIVYEADYWDDAGKHTFQCVETGNPIVSVTFQVDMNQETVSSNGVHLTGNFQGWVADSTAMTDPDGDGIYAVTVELPINAEYEYKFINGNAFGMDESVPSACAKGGNRFVNIGGSDVTLNAVCYASCGVCVGVYEVTFKVDMSKETISENGVHIAGSFQNWDPGASEMTDADSDGIYEATFMLNGANTYQYKFVNGNAWGEDEAVPAECALDNNRFIEISTSDSTTLEVCFGSCELCTSSTKDLLVNESMLLIPNPTSGNVNVRFHTADESSVVLKTYNALGKLILSEKHNVSNGVNNIMVNIDIPGIYFIVIETKKGNAFRKLIRE